MLKKNIAVQGSVLTPTPLPLKRGLNPLHSYRFALAHHHVSASVSLISMTVGLAVTCAFAMSSCKCAMLVARSA